MKVAEHAFRDVEAAERERERAMARLSVIQSEGFFALSGARWRRWQRAVSAVRCSLVAVVALHMRERRWHRAYKRVRS